MLGYGGPTGFGKVDEVLFCSLVFRNRFRLLARLTVPLTRVYLAFDQNKVAWQRDSDVRTAVLPCLS